MITAGRVETICNIFIRSTLHEFLVYFLHLFCSWTQLQEVSFSVASSQVFWEISDMEEVHCLLRLLPKFVPCLC